MSINTTSDKKTNPDFRGLKPEDFLGNASDYDVVIFTDGSGTTQDKPCGVAYAIFFKHTNSWTFGGRPFKNGTNNVAEISAVISALVRADSVAALDGKSVLIVTDSELLVKQWAEEYTINEKMQDFWDEVYRFQDIASIHFRHVYRNTNPASAWCDNEAKRQRRMLLDGETTV